MSVPFNRPLVLGNEYAGLEGLLESGNIGGGGEITSRCEAWLRENITVPAALLTPSCSAALEMAVILADVGPGDEVVMPSFTFPSMANAVVLRGGVPVFVDIRSDTLNIDESLIEEALGARTKVIMPMHYAGVACEMDHIMRLAERFGLVVIEDTAQALLAKWRGQQLGSLAHMAAISFHQTKNIHCGEGGALLIRDSRLSKEAEIVRDKGTDRAAFMRGEVQKYRWRSLGSSFMPSELQAAWLYAQLKSAHAVTSQRVRIWNAYHDALEELETDGFLRRPRVPSECAHNAHIYYVLLENSATRDALQRYLRERGFETSFHYVPLHSAPAGRKYGRTVGNLANAEKLSASLLRLPLWIGMESHVECIVDAVRSYFLADFRTGRESLSLEGL